MLSNRRYPIHSWIGELLGKLESTFTPNQIRFRWNRKLRTTAGRAVYEDSTIELNPYLFIRPDKTDECFEVVAHELCHIEAWRLVGSKEGPHGPTWQSLMVKLGLEPERCHEMDVETLRVHRKKVAHQCGRCRTEVMLGIVRAKRIRRGVIYVHMNCGGRLRPTG